MATVAAMLMVSISACSVSLEEQVAGPWRLTNSKIHSLDSIAQARSIELTKGLQSALEQLNAEIDSTYAEPKRSELIARRSDINKSINDYNPENIKNLFLKQQEQLKDSLLFIFGSDKHITIRLGNSDTYNVNTGSWSMSGDTIFTVFDNYPSETLIVRSVNSGHLELISKAVGNYGVDLTLELSKY